MRRERGEKRGDGASLSGQHKVRADVGQGLEHESSRGHARMGRDQRGAFDPQVAGIQDVEIEWSGRVAFGLWGASEFDLRGAQMLKQCGGSQGGLDLHHSVEEGRRPRRTVDRFRLVNRGDGGGAFSLVPMRDCLASGAQVLQTVAEI